jgi:hypothetical protein
MKVNTKGKVIGAQSKNVILLSEAVFIMTRYLSEQKKSKEK